MWLAAAWQNWYGPWVWTQFSRERFANFSPAHEIRELPGQALYVALTESPVDPGLAEIQERYWIDTGMLELIHRIWPPNTAGQGPPRLTTPEVKTTLIEDAMRGAEWMALCLAESGYNPDFTLNSLRDLDKFIDEHSKDGKPKPGGLLSESVGIRLFGLGCWFTGRPTCCGQQITRAR